jgi:hypothetical protein
MPFTWQINIESRPGVPGYGYSPVALDSVAIGDQIYFTNNDGRPHWPGLVGASGVAGNPQTYFMPYQIPAGSSSTACVAGVAGTVKYADSLDSNPARPTGTVTVIALPAAGAPATPTIASTGDR